MILNLPMKSCTKKAAMIIPVLGVLTFGIIATASAAEFGEKPELTTDQQAAIEESMELRDQGLHEEARAVLEEANVPMQKNKRMKHKMDPERHEAVKAAVDANDYEAFLEAMADAPFVDKLTEEHFNTMVEIHALREAGDKEAARELMKELRPNKKAPQKGNQRWQS